MIHKPEPSVHPGLANPKVSARPTSLATEPSNNTAPTTFRTHIPEPRWQQIVSVVLVIIGICLWLTFVFHQK
jgi:hypothetical protein